MITSTNFIVTDCYSEKYAVPSVCVRYILSKLTDKFYPKEVEMLRDKLAQMEKKLG